MALITWDDELYSIGIALIDQQHKRLVDLINLIDSKKDSADKKFVEKILNTLVEYTKSHFLDEEQMMIKMRFPDFANHKKQHQKFIDMVDQSVEKYRNTQNDPAALTEILEFLKNWLMKHILVSDRSYVQYLLHE